MYELICFQTQAADNWAYTWSETFQTSSERDDTILEYVELTVRPDVLFSYVKVDRFVNPINSEIKAFAL